MEMPLPGEDVQEAEEEHMKDLCNKYGIAYDDGVKNWQASKYGILFGRRGLCPAFEDVRGVGIQARRACGEARAGSS